MDFALITAIVYRKRRKEYIQMYIFIDPEETGLIKTWPFSQMTEKHDGKKKIEREKDENNTVTDI